MNDWYLDTSDPKNPYGWTDEGDAFPVYSHGLTWHPITTRRRWWWERRIVPVLDAAFSKRVWVAAALVYVIVFLGGSLSFGYTHRCVRSHEREVPVNNEGDVETVTVCDFYTANGKRWTLLDPFRALPGWIWGG